MKQIALASRILFALVAISFAISPAAQAWIWPLSGTATPDEMNTSFGPRINNSMWDFHDGMDLPGTVGTNVVAVAGGTVFREGPGGTDGYSSRHVILQVTHPTDGTLYVAYLHLDSIAPGITEGGTVSQGTVLGTLGADDATYPHLHFEVRRGSPLQVFSVHPIQYLPFSFTANFTTPVLDRAQRRAEGRIARITFTSPVKEGDLRVVEVDLMDGAALLATRRVDLDDKTTVQEGNGDGFQWVNDISLEGYQRSNMPGDGRTDYHYGVLLRKLPETCDGLVARVTDWGGDTKTSALLALGEPGTFGDHLDFEDGTLPPAGWSQVTSVSGTGTQLAVDNASALTGTRGLHATDASTTEGSSQSASVEHALPAGRIQWTAEGQFRFTSLGLGAGQNAYILYFRNGTGLSAAASARNNSGTVQAGILVKNPDASTTSSFSANTVTPGVSHRWTLNLLRVGTRETTAVLYWDGVEIVRKVWDGRTFEMDGFRAGLGFTSTGASAELHADEVRIEDGGLAGLPSFRAGEVDTLTVAKAAASDVTLAWNGSCAAPDASDYAVYEGALGAWTSHAPRLCTTASALNATFTPAAGNVYYIVVRHTAAGEGSYGADSAATPRPPSATACADTQELACP